MKRTQQSANEDAVSPVVGEFVNIEIYDSSTDKVIATAQATVLS
jgi:hypothetical protein